MPIRSNASLELCRAFWWTVAVVMPQELSQASHDAAVPLSLNLMRRQDMSLQRSTDQPKTQKQPQVCGSIIDAQGREIPITEQMIQKACKDLEQSRVEKVKQG